MVDVNPALKAMPGEAAIIGRIVVGFGEVEVLTCRLAAIAMKDQTTIFKTLYHLRTTSTRIDSADTLMRPACKTLILQTEQEHTLLAVRNCMRIRNQYAHCNWSNDPTAGLFC